MSLHEPPKLRPDLAHANRLSPKSGSGHLVTCPLHFFEDVYFMAHLEDSPWIYNMVLECWIIPYLLFETGCLQSLLKVTLDFSRESLLVSSFYDSLSEDSHMGCPRHIGACPA